MPPRRRRRRTTAVPPLYRRRRTAAVPPRPRSRELILISLARLLARFDPFGAVGREGGMALLTAKTRRCDGDDHGKCDGDRPRAAEGKAGDARSTCSPTPCPTLRPRSIPGEKAARGYPSTVASLILIPIIHSTLTDLQASSLTTGEEQSQCCQSRNELQARNAIAPLLYPAPGDDSPHLRGP